MRLTTSLLMALLLCGGAAEARFSSFRVMGATRQGNAAVVKLAVSHTGQPATANFYVMPRTPEFGKDIFKLGEKVKTVKLRPGRKSRVTLRLPLDSPWIKPGAKVSVGCHFALHNGVNHYWGIGSRAFGINRQGGTTFAVPNSRLAGRRPLLYRLGLRRPLLSRPGLSRPGLSRPGLSRPGLSQPGLSRSGPRR